MSRISRLIRHSGLLFDHGDKMHLSLRTATFPEHSPDAPCPAAGELADGVRQRDPASQPATPATGGVALPHSESAALPTRV